MFLSSTILYVLKNYTIFLIVKWEHGFLTKIVFTNKFGNEQNVNIFVLLKYYEAPFRAIF